MISAVTNQIKHRAGDNQWLNYFVATIEIATRSGVGRNTNVKYEG